MTKLQVLGLRELNRATLDRQFLLRRTDADAAEVVEHLIGLQTQIPGNHYTALWARIADFSAEDFSQRFEAREFVRISLHRSTIHTATARDARALRPLLQPVQERMLMAGHRKRLEGVDLDRLAARADGLLQDGPMTFDELGKLLAEVWPEHEKQALGNAARSMLPLVQVPPRGLWQQGGLARHTTIERWLGAGPAVASAAGSAAGPTAGPTADELVLRYLAAFGPASVADAQFWCGLTGLKENFERLRGDGLLAVFKDAAGVELFDLPEAPRPEPGVAAPVRFLPDYDNVFIGHKDRSRIYHPEVDHKKHIWLKNGLQPQFTVDGFICGIWRLTADKKRSSASLAVTALRPLAGAERAAVEAEAAELLAFQVPEAAREIRWTPLEVAS
jgi:hypothetical protein